MHFADTLAVIPNLIVQWAVSTSHGHVPWACQAKYLETCLIEYTGLLTETMNHMEM